METIHIEIVTPQGLIYEGNIKSATLPGSEGEFGILPNHASLVTLLKAGVIEIVKEDDAVEMIAINWGYIKVDENKTTILADGAVAISGTEVSKSIEEAKELIKSMSDSDIAIASATAKIESAAKGHL